MVSRVWQRWRRGWEIEPAGKTLSQCLRVAWAPRQRFPPLPGLWTSGRTASHTVLVASLTFRLGWPAESTTCVLVLSCDTTGVDFCLFTSGCFTFRTASEIEKKRIFLLSWKDKMLHHYQSLGITGEITHRNV